jgi:hypothetical protein
MKTMIIRIGFVIWRLAKRNGSGRRIVDADTHRIRRHIAFRTALLVRIVVLAMERDSQLGVADWR